ncbi:hypothetical protein EBS02_03575 [bacterium]|nr:hypothetical protein [bacterium]
MTPNIIKTDNYLLVVDDSEIKEGDFFMTDDNRIELSAPDWRAREWHKKIIAHLPLNNSPVLQGVDLLPPLEDDVEKLAEEFKSSYKKVGVTDYEVSSFIVGYNKAKEKYKFTEEDIIHLLHKTARKYFQEGREYKGHMAIAGDPLHGVRRELINMVQSLHQYPKEFECEIDLMYQGESLASASGFSLDTKDIYTTKITTNSQGFRQWVGSYIY